MPAYSCDNPAVEAAFKKLEQLVTREGGWLSEHLTIYCEGGHMGLRTDLPAKSRELLISIPKSCFIPVDDIEFALAGQRLVIKTLPAGFSPSMREQIEIIVEIYNLTDKILALLETSPRHVFAKDEDMTQHLLAGRAGTGLVDLFDQIQQVGRDEALISSFLKTRYFIIGGAANHIIPFIDYANHHSKACGFVKARNEAGQHTLEVRNFQPVAGSNECFVQYGFFDVYDTYLMFGFAAGPAPFVRSVPMTIRFGDLGKVIVNASINKVRKQPLPEALSALAPFFPQIDRVDEATLKISHLIIPDAASPLALKSLLRGYINTLAPSLSEAEKEVLVNQAEEQVLLENEAFYGALDHYLESRRDDYKDNATFKTAQTMAEIQISGLKAYRLF